MDSDQWDLAGFALGKRVPGTDIHIPAEVGLDVTETLLEWRSKYPSPKTAEPDPSALNTFVQLWQQPPQAIVRFAQRWGTLQLDTQPDAEDWTLNRESIETWRHFSRRACAVLNIGARLARGMPGKVDDWQVFQGLKSRLNQSKFEYYVSEYSVWLDRWFFKGLTTQELQRISVHHQRQFLMLELAGWLKLSRVGFIVFPHGARWELAIDYNGQLFGFLALQLALTIVGAHSLYTCSGCGTPYVRNKKPPRPGQSNYCDRCGRDVALRKADQRRRQKVANARRLHSEGHSLSDIASQLRTTPASVRRWLKKRKIVKPDVKKTRSR